jgi:uncharacterized protein involved in oxidation of intracellular sulfur
MANRHNEINFIPVGPLEGRLRMRILFILNEAPYGSEKTCNALRLAVALKQSQPAAEIRLFLMSDAVTTALPHQTTPQGTPNLEWLLSSVLAEGGQVRLCVSCCEARGLKDAPLVQGVEIANLAALAEWTLEAERVLVF